MSVTLPAGALARVLDGATSQRVERVLELLGERVHLFPATHEHEWSAQCPLHSADGYHLTVSISGDGLIQLVCDKECALSAIAAAVGLAGEDLTDPVSTDDGVAPEFSDDNLAIEFTKRHGERYRFTAKWGKWHRWSRGVWVEDTTLAVFDQARLVLRELAATCEKKTTATMITSARTIASVERLARADRTHAATVEQWDADIWSLNTPGGVVNLKNGELRSARHQDYMTRQTAAAPGNARPALWHQFLEKVTDQNAELISYLQRVAGYCLTGSTEEHAMFFLHGKGGNGKGTYVNTIAGLLNSYARQAPMSMFTASKFDQHPTELAMLHGARLVNAQETDKGRRWAEAKIKSLTGGDMVSARFMRMDHFEYLPQFKLLIAANDKPHLTNVDNAMRRRFNLVPFTVDIQETERIFAIQD
nr:phage/plasmid primase, P4 family [Gemmatimonadota bacterium]